MRLSGGRVRCSDYVEREATANVEWICSCCGQELGDGSGVEAATSVQHELSDKHKDHIEAEKEAAPPVPRIAAKNKSGKWTCECGKDLGSDPTRRAAAHVQQHHEGSQDHQNESHEVNRLLAKPSNFFKAWTRVSDDPDTLALAKSIGDYLGLLGWGYSGGRHARACGGGDSRMYSRMRGGSG